MINENFVVMRWLVRTVPHSVSRTPVTIPRVLFHDFSNGNMVFSSMACQSSVRSALPWSAPGRRAPKQLIDLHCQWRSNSTHSAIYSVAEYLVNHLPSRLVKCEGDSEESEMVDHTRRHWFGTPKLVSLCLFTTSIAIKTVISDNNEVAGRNEALLT